MTITELITWLRGLEARATPGDWDVETCGNDWGLCGSGPFYDYKQMDGKADEDAELIAAMRNNITRLLDTLELYGQTMFNNGAELTGQSEKIKELRAENAELRFRLAKVREALWKGE